MRNPNGYPTTTSTTTTNLVHDEDEVDDDVEEGLTEYHEHDEGRAEQAAEELRTQRRAAQLRAQHEWVPVVGEE